MQMQLIDAGGAEIALLSDQHRLLTQYMGGIFPRDIDTAPLQHVLDLACGPGDWGQDVAFERQDTRVIGIDSSRQLVTHARTMAGVQGLDNAFFQVMDIREPLDFDDDSFDFIQARLLTSILSPAEWSSLLAECRRILRPGGILRLVEAEWPQTNSPAVQHLGRMVNQAQRQVGRSYSPDGHHLDALVPWLRDARFKGVCSQLYEIPLGPPGFVGMHPLMELVRMELYLMEPALLRLGVTMQEEFATLLEAMELDANNYTFDGRPDFRGVQRIAEAYGVKAASS
jgi:ubiquinone/menaquinone biosynthesis C-methylase UbiE